MKVLIVTYYWPPSGGGGVQRWVKFAKNLRDFGWEPIIYTPENPNVPVYDESLLLEIPQDIIILKQPIKEPYKLAKLFSCGNTSNRIGASGEADRKPSFLKRMALWIRGNMFVPDARILWVKPSTKFLGNWLELNPVDVIITTGPPHSMHLIGLALKRKHGHLSWVADFRDPWSDMDYLSEFNLGPKALKKIEKMEAEVVESTDQILLTSKRAGIKLLGEVNHPKSVCIPNGWEPEDFPKNISNKDASLNKVITLGHFGSLQGSRNCPGLWGAIANYNTKNEVQIFLKFAGNVSDEIKRAVAKAGVVHCEYLGNLPHKTSIVEMLQCDALLLIHNDTDSAINSTPGKIFEYLGTSLPIISICRNEGDLTDLLAEHNLPSATHNDVKEAELMLDSITNKPSIDASPYTRKKLTETLVTVLNELQKT